LLHHQVVLNTLFDVLLELILCKSLHAWHPGYYNQDYKKQPGFGFVNHTVIFAKMIKMMILTGHWYTGLKSSVIFASSISRSIIIDQLEAENVRFFPL